MPTMRAFVSTIVIKILKHINMKKMGCFKVICRVMEGLLIGDYLPLNVTPVLAVKEWVNQRTLPYSIEALECISQMTDSR